MKHGTYFYKDKNYTTQMTQRGLYNEIQYQLIIIKQSGTPKGNILVIV